MKKRRVAAMKVPVRLSRIVARTLKARGPDIHANIVRNNPLLEWLTRKDCIRGGSKA